MVNGRLILFPSLLAQTAPADVLPSRNIDLIRKVSYFVVEELRTARRFLKACDKSIDIDSLHFDVLNEHTDPTAVRAMLDPIFEGHDVGVISEAGCPAVADPGADIVAAAQKAGIEVVPLVGPSSILMSLMASGFNGQRFTFRGYLPVEAKARAEAVRDMERDIARNRCTQIFIETPYRNNRLLADLCAALPTGMSLCVALDITGPAQSIITKKISSWKAKMPELPKAPAIFLLFD